MNYKLNIMANILLRSPYFVAVTTGGHLSAQMALTIDDTSLYDTKTQQAIEQYLK